MTDGFKKRKILVMNWQDLTNPYSGGAEIHLHEIFKRLVSWGHDVLLFGNRHGDAPPEEEIDGVRIMRRGRRNNVNFVAPYYYSRRLHAMNFDLVVEGVNKVPFYSPLYVKEPILVIVHHLFGTTAFREATFPGASYVYLAEMLMPTVYRKERFEVISESTKDDLVKRGIPEGNIRVVYCGIDPALYFPPYPLLEEKDPIIVCLGRIKKYKSIDDIIRAFVTVRREYPRTTLEIIGEGDYQRALEALVDELDVRDGVRFLGFLPHEEKIRRLQRAIVAVNSSPKEGWGLTVTEANACGTTVVAADSPGLRESVRDRETGFLYPYGNTDVLAEKLGLLVGNPELRRRMELKALKWARSLTWDRAARETLEYIDQIIDTSPCL